MEAIQDNAIYAKEADKHLPGLYYLVAWKGYPKEENTWEPSLVVIYLRKMISNFHKDHPEKPILILATLESTTPLAKPTI